MDKEFYSIEEVSAIIQRNRGTVYNRMKLLGIKAKKFQMDRKAYVTAEEMEKIKAVIEKPWLAGEKSEEAA